MLLEILIIDARNTFRDLSPIWDNTQATWNEKAKMRSYILWILNCMDDGTCFIAMGRVPACL